MQIEMKNPFLCFSYRRTSGMSFTLLWAAFTSHPVSWSLCTYVYTSLPRLARVAASGSSPVHVWYRRNRLTSGRPVSLRAHRPPTLRSLQDQLWKMLPRSRTSRSRYRLSHVTLLVTSARRKLILAEALVYQWKRRIR